MFCGIAQEFTDSLRARYLTSCPRYGEAIELHFSSLSQAIVRGIAWVQQEIGHSPVMAIEEVCIVCGIDLGAPRPERLRRRLVGEGHSDSSLAETVHEV